MTKPSTAPPRVSILGEALRWAFSPSGLVTIAGGVGIATTTNATILHSGGYATANAPMIAAMGLGVFAGAWSLGTGKKGLGRIASLLVLAMVAGEAYNFFATAETTVVGREEDAAPLRAAQERHNKAVQRLAELEAPRDLAPATDRVRAAQQGLDDAKAGAESQRVRSARKTLADAQAAVATEAANGGCRSACKGRQDDAKAAQAAVTAAIAADAGDQQAAIARAEAEMQTALSAAETQRIAELDKARADVKANPKPASATPLADRLGCKPWVLDLLVALLKSLGANLLSGSLIALGGRLKAQPEALTTTATDAKPVAELQKSEPPTPPAGPNGPKRRGRRRDPDVTDFVSKYREKHGKSPNIPTMRAEFPDLDKSTLWRNANA